MSWPDPDPSSFPAEAAPVCFRLGAWRIGLLAVWAVGSFGLCYWARDLQALAGGGAWAYALAGQGALMLFVVLVLVNAAVFRQEDDGEAASKKGSRGSP